MRILLILCMLLLRLSDAVSGGFVCPEYVYAFGDSLTDTGNAHAEHPAREYNLTRYPYGMSYCFPERPCERTRFCDGRLIVDFTAQAFGIPFLEPYSRRFDDSAYGHGVNFAYSGGTVRRLSNDFFLAHEVENYFDFRAEFDRGHDVNVSTALHMIPEIGGNDYTHAFGTGVSPADANAELDDEVLGLIQQSVEKLYSGGARQFFIFNQPPAGCTPYYLTLFSDKSEKDQYRCLSTYNAVFQTFNRKLKAAVETYRQTWPDTVILYFDWYAAVFEVLQNQAEYGIDAAGLRACCGGGGPHNYNPDVLCGAGTVCSSPEHAIYWDALHMTEAMYRVMATFALSGKFVDGPSLEDACNLDFTSFYRTNPFPSTCTS